MSHTIVSSLESIQLGLSVIELGNLTHWEPWTGEGGILFPQPDNVFTLPRHPSAMQSPGSHHGLACYSENHHLPSPLYCFLFWMLAKAGACSLCHSGLSPSFLEACPHTPQHLHYGTTLLSWDPNSKSVLPPFPLSISFLLIASKIYSKTVLLSFS